MSNLNEAQRKWLEDLFAIGGAGGTRFGLAARAREARFQDDNDNVAGGFAVPDDSSAGTTGSLLQTARMSAPPGGPAPGGPSGGGDGSGIDLTDEERIKLLKEWQKDGKLDGDTQSLRERLRDKRNKPLQKEARKEFDEIRAKIERGEKPKVQPRAADTQPRAVGGRAQQRIERDDSPHSTAPKEERISTAGKTKLPDLPDVKKLPEGEQREFGKGLKDDHKQGQTGKEIPLDSTQKPPKGHDHLNTPAETQDALQEHQGDQSTARKERQKRDEGKPSRENRRPSRKPKGGGGGNDGGSPPPTQGSEDGGSPPPTATGKSSQPHVEPPTPTSKTSSSAPKVPPAPKVPAPTATVSPNINIKAAEELVHKVEEVQKLSKAPKIETEKVQKQNLSLKNEAESLAKELQKHPEFASIRASNAKEFYAGVRSKFGSIRNGLSKVAIVAMRVADAYQLVEQLGYILDSKSMSEVLHKSLKVGGDIAKERIKFGALRFVFRSTPAAIGVMVFLGDMDMNLGLSASGEFDVQIADLVNSVRPGSVQPAFHADNLTRFKDDEAKKLFEEIRAEAKGTLTDALAKGLTQMGYEDGLVGAKKTKFEVSDAEKSILGVNEKWFEEMYNKGNTQSSRKREDAVKRARETGFKDGKEGKQANFAPLFDWPEVNALRQRDFQREGKTPFNFQQVFDQYKNAYEEGHREGRKTFDTRSPQKFKIGIRDVTREKYSRENLYAHVEYSNGTKGVVSEEVTWTTDKPDIAKIYFDKGAKMTMAHLLGLGTAKITATFPVDGKIMEDTITITVKPPNIKIVPAAGTYSAGFRTQFVARTESWPALSSDWIVWSSSPPGIVDIDQDGNAVMLKGGDAQIVVTERETSPVMATAKIKVVP